MRRLRDVRGRLYAEYHEVNQRHFAGLLPTVPIHIRTLTEFGHLWTDDHTGQPRYIVIQEHHALTDSWEKVRDTLLHEMVHVWQAAQGYRTGHGPDFKARAKALGCDGRAAC